MSDFKRLKVWQKAQALTLSARSAAAMIRGADNQSLRNQLIRAAESIPTNIVEGSVQQSRKQFTRFAQIAIASSSELEYHLITARDRGLIRKGTSVTLIDQTIEVRKMLYGLVRYLQSPSGNTATRTDDRTRN
jgi:four helix bundle protein